MSDPKRMLIGGGGASESERALLRLGQRVDPPGEARSLVWATLVQQLPPGVGAPGSTGAPGPAPSGTPPAGTEAGSLAQSSSSAAAGQGAAVAAGKGATVGASAGKGAAGAALAGKGAAGVVAGKSASTLVATLLGGTLGKAAFVGVAAAGLVVGAQGVFAPAHAPPAGAMRASVATPRDETPRDQTTSPRDPIATAHESDKHVDGDAVPLASDAPSAASEVSPAPASTLLATPAPASASLATPVTSKDQTLTRSGETKPSRAAADRPLVEANARRVGRDEPIDAAPASSGVRGDAGAKADAPAPSDRLPTASRLLEESRLTEQARSALRAGQPGQALRVLEDARTRYPGGVLTQEREALIVEALAAAGQSQAAAAGAAAFLRTYPSSPHASRVRGFLVP